MLKPILQQLKGHLDGAILCRLVLSLRSPTPNFKSQKSNGVLVGLRVAQPNLHDSMVLSFRLSEGQAIYIRRFGRSPRRMIEMPQAVHGGIS